MSVPVYSLTLVAAVAVGAWVYTRDRYEREPVWAVLLAGAVGFAGMWVLGVVDGWAIAALDVSARLPKATIVAVVEEAGKLAAILLLARVLIPRQFNDPVDGLIYGRFVGLGMAVEESLLYLGLAPATWETVGAEVVRLMAHSLMGGMVGFAIGIGAAPHAPRRPRPGLVALLLLASTLLHLAWNVIAYGPKATPLDRLLPMAIMLVMMGAWRWLLWVADARSRRLFVKRSAPVAAGLSG